MSYLIENPGATEEEIAQDLKLEFIDVVSTITKLFKKGKIKEFEE